RHGIAAAPEQHVARALGGGVAVVEMPFRHDLEASQLRGLKRGRVHHEATVVAAFPRGDGNRDPKRWIVAWGKIGGGRNPIRRRIKLFRRKLFTRYARGESCAEPVASARPPRERGRIAGWQTRMTGKPNPRLTDAAKTGRSS